MHSIHVWSCQRTKPINYSVTLPNKRFLIHDILFILIIPHRGSCNNKNPILGVLSTKWDNRNKGNFQESAFLSIISKAK